jgi:RNA polymerase sigma-70 factor (ECF subfamily)
MELGPAPRTSFITAMTGIRAHTELGTRSVAGFEDTALPHIESVGRFALALTRNQADADDLVQETFLRAFRGWHTFTPGTECRRWLFTICRNTFIGWKRRDRVYVESQAEDIDAMPAAITHMQAVSEGITDVFDRIDVRPAIESAVHALPEPHRSILVLVDLEEMTYEEAAGVLGIPLGTVRSRLYRARRHVQEALLAHARDLGIGAAAREVRCSP